MLRQIAQQPIMRISQPRLRPQRIMRISQPQIQKTMRTSQRQPIIITHTIPRLQIQEEMEHREAAVWELHQIQVHPHLYL